MSYYDRPETVTVTAKNISSFLEADPFVDLTKDSLETLKPIVTALNEIGLFKFYIAGGLSTYLMIRQQRKLEVNLNRYYHDIDIYVPKETFDRLSKYIFLEKKGKILEVELSNLKTKVQIMNMENLTMNQILDTFDLSICKNYIEVEPNEVPYLYVHKDANVTTIKVQFFNTGPCHTGERLAKYSDRYPFLKIEMDAETFKVIAKSDFEKDSIEAANEKRIETSKRFAKLELDP